MDMTTKEKHSENIAEGQNNKEKKCQIDNKRKRKKTKKIAKCIKFGQLIFSFLFSRMMVD